MTQTLLRPREPDPSRGDLADRLGEALRLALGGGMTALPFSAGSSLEALFDRVEGLR